MTSFAIIGEGPAALAVMMHVVTQGGSVPVIFTNKSDNCSIVDFASDFGISVHESTDLKKSDFNEKITFSNCEWLLNVFSSQILPMSVLGKFGEKALNVHNGPLPEYTGIHVTQWAIRNGETCFAVTVHAMEKSIDGGKIVATRDYPVKPSDTGLSLFVTSMREGVTAMNGVVDRILAGEPLEGVLQDNSRRRVYRHDEALDPNIDWTLPAKDVCNFIRAGNYRPLTSPTYTAEFTTFSGDTVSVTKAEPEFGAKGEPKAVLELTDCGPLIACGDAGVRLLQAHLGEEEVGAVRWAQILGTELRTKTGTLRGLRESGLAFARDLGPVDRLVAAKLVEEAAKEFYALAPFSGDLRSIAIADLFQLEGSDVFECRVYRDSGRVIGIQAAVPGGRYDSSQLISTIRLFQQLDPDQKIRFRKNLEVFRENIPPFSTDSLYLARITVAKEYRRQGIGRILLDDFTSMAAPSEIVSLHAKADNVAAIAFYQRHGFSVSSCSETDYLLMESAAPAV